MLAVDDSTFRFNVLQVTVPDRFAFYQNQANLPNSSWDSA
jgi:hypothetical protein